MTAPVARSTILVDWVTNTPIATTVGAAPLMVAAPNEIAVPLLLAPPDAAGKLVALLVTA